MVVASPEMQKYFEELTRKCSEAYEIANKARAKGYDPADKVEVQLASNMAERVVGLISVVAPQIVGSGVVERIIDLEKKYGALDWRVALQISIEVAEERFCKFKDKNEAIEVGVRVGFAYGTVGVVSSPLEGLITIDIKKRRDGKGEYFCLNYGGPVRNAGGTAAAWSVIISDFVRKKMGYAEYDPDENEIKRCPTELEDYHERVTNLQYFPSKKESDFMLRNLPVEISGDASEDKEVSNYKDLPRVPTNKIRSGFCLIHSSCIPLKAEKLWKQLSKWGKDFDMDQWNFLEEFIKIKKEVHAKGKGAEKSGESNQEKPKVTPDFTFIKDLVAGRPVIGHPMRIGGFRLRYGRSRTSGYSAQSINPCTMHVLNDFIATGTQLKVERPGKGAAFTPCDTIEGPIVKIKDGSVIRIETEQKAKEIKKQIVEVLFLGDALINYGDFLNRGHSLVPPGYCEEWWVQELEKEIVNIFGNLDNYKLAEIADTKPEELEKVLKKPLKYKPRAKTAIKIAKATKTYLHPYHSYFWNSIDKKELPKLFAWLHRMKVESDDDGAVKAVLAIDAEQKRNIELVGIPHIVATNEFVVFGREDTEVLKELLKIGVEDVESAVQKISEIISDDTVKDVVSALNKYSDIKQRDKGGIFIGSRMGRPEKAKMRKLTGSPHTLFPVGEEGGRMRSFQSALEKGKIRAEFAVFKCPSCEEQAPFGVCPSCDVKTKRIYSCKMCGEIEEAECPKHGTAAPAMMHEVNIHDYFYKILKKLGTRTYPDLIKGVRGTSNREHIPEHFIKGILRAKYDVHVNKEGTVRYDASELPITHFKPKEIFVSVEKLKSLGYTKDIRGRPLENENQILEIKPQDIVVPCCPDSPDEPADAILTRTAQFIDEELVKLYGLKPFYNIQTREDIVGHLAIGLAPHTSAGTICRIVGFSKTQGFFAHPLTHAAMRRDCDGDEGCFLLLMDTFLNFSRKYLPDSRGSTMDAALVLTTILTPAEVDDMAFDVDRVWTYPLEFYEACLEYKKPWDVKIETIQSVLDKEGQYEGMGFTHDTEDINAGVQMRCVQ
ncbi:DNA polymerase II large subunit [Nanoarchaeota archaeon]